MVRGLAGLIAEARDELEHLALVVVGDVGQVIVPACAALVSNNEAASPRSAILSDLIRVISSIQMCAGLSRAGAFGRPKCEGYARTLRSDWIEKRGGIDEIAKENV